MKFILCLLFSFLFCRFFARKPNVILILADDLGYAELGSYGQKDQDAPPRSIGSRGHAVHPQLLGQCGVLAPSRCVLMTGKHPGHAFIRNNGEVKPEGQRPIPKSEFTMAEMFKGEDMQRGRSANGAWAVPVRKGILFIRDSTAFSGTIVNVMPIATIRITSGATLSASLWTTSLPCRVMHHFRKDRTPPIPEATMCSRERNTLPTGSTRRLSSSSARTRTNPSSFIILL